MKEQAHYNRLCAAYASQGRIFRNNTGAVTTADGRFITFGLCKGSSDLIGWTEIEITAYEIDGKPIDPTNLVVFPNTQEGLLARAGRTIKAAAALEKASLNFANEPTPLMVLKSNGTSLPADRVAKILQAWRTARQNKSTAFLNADVM